MVGGGGRIELTPWVPILDLQSGRYLEQDAEYFERLDSNGANRRPAFFAANLRADAYPNEQLRVQSTLVSNSPSLKSSWRMRKKAKNIHASKLARQRWAKVPVNERAKQVPRSGGRPRTYPKCPRYGSHRFSPRTGRCPCGYKRPPE